MISEKYADMTTKGSIIREFAQYASKRAAEIGKEKKQVVINREKDLLPLAKNEGRED